MVVNGLADAHSLLALFQRSLQDNQEIHVTLRAWLTVGLGTEEDHFLRLELEDNLLHRVVDRPLRNAAARGDWRNCNCVSSGHGQTSLALSAPPPSRGARPNKETCWLGVRFAQFPCCDPLS